ncbi:MAG: hypothetical protein IMZ61_09345 [Planctomycetes bacterium]|nr:hypothetical protein [Planctomycetota bacterium]
MKVIRNDIYKALIVSLLSLLAFIGNGIHTQQTDIASRLRIVEINQARIMDRMGIEVALGQLGSPRPSSHLEPK